MIVTLRRLKELYSSVTVDVSHDGSIITVTGLIRINGGQKGIKCPKGWSMSAFGGRSAMFVGPKSSMALENIIEQIKIHFDVHEQQHHCGATAGIAPRPSNAGEVFIPNPTLVGGMLKVTICIAKTYKSSLPEGSTVVAEPGQCTMATVTLPASELQGGPNGYTYGSLQFVFHKNIASQVEALLHPVEETQPPTTPFLAPPPILLDGDEPSTGSWADDAVGASTPAPASAPAQETLSRSEEANALTGIKVSMSARDRNALKKEQNRLAAEQKRLEEEQKRLDEEQKTKDEEARKKAFYEESIRLELEAQKLADKKRREMEALKALGEEYDKLDSFVKQHLGITKEQFLANPEECMARIRELQNSAVQEPVPEEEEEEEGPILPPVFIKTPDPDVVGNIVNIGQEHGVQVPVTTRSDTKYGKMHVIGVSDLILRGVLNFALSRKGNEMMCGLGSDNGTLVWGHYAFVCSQCYDALVSIRPDLADMVRQVMVKRVQMKHQPSKGFSAGQGILPTPLPQYGPVYVPYIPVYNMWGQVVEWQVVPGV
jgi:hypothetical protein